MKALINGKEYSFEASETILDVARRSGHHIPTLCEMHDIDHAPGTCRVCMVEVRRDGDSEPTFVTACNTPMGENWQVLTRSPKVQSLRRMQVELLMGDHHQDCATCARHGDCELLDVADSVGLTSSRFVRPTESAPVNADSAIVYDQGRCVRCFRCVSVCRDQQGVDALEITGRACKAGIQLKNGLPTEDSICVACGQCVMVCPTGALAERDDTQKVIDYLADPEIVTVFQIAPAIRVGFGEEFGLQPGSNVEGQIVTALHQIGADVVLDTNFAADLVIMEEGTEVLQRLKQRDGVTFTSCCPGWVNFAEKHYPEILDRLSTTRSPQQCLGSLAKHYLPEKMGLDPKKVRVISVMPCTAKKEEAARADFREGDMADVDVVLTIREFARLLRREGVDLKSLAPSPFDNPYMAEYTGAGVIFGTTGGVMEAALRTVYAVVNGRELEAIELHAVRGFDSVKEATIDVGGELGQVKVAICHGLKAARAMTEAVLAGTAQYDFIEVMACPGGCIDGGGHIKAKKRYLKHAEERRDGLYAIDRQTGVRQSHRNQQVQQLYKDFLGEPLGERSHHLLHTHYHDRKKTFEADVKAIWAAL